MIYEVYNAIFNGVFGTTGCENGVDREQKGCGGGSETLLRHTSKFGIIRLFPDSLTRGGKSQRGGKSSGIALITKSSVSFR